MNEIKAPVSLVWKDAVNQDGTPVGMGQDPWIVDGNGRRWALGEFVAVLNAVPDAGDVRASLNTLADKDLDPSIDVEAATRKARAQLFAEKYAQPDADDVEEIAQRVHDNLVAPYAARESALRTERDALLAENGAHGIAARQVIAENTALAAQNVAMREALQAASEYLPGRIGTANCGVCNRCGGMTESGSLHHCKKCVREIATTALAIPPTPIEERVAAVIDAAREVTEVSTGVPGKDAYYIPALPCVQLYDALQALDGKGDSSR